MQMLIQKFILPLAEVSDLGLKAIHMNRLGRFVALAGKNGAGKSRILGRLAACVDARAQGFEQLQLLREAIKNLESAIGESHDPDRLSEWDRNLAECNRKLAITLERVVADESLGKFKAIHYVPKKLDLHDPRKSVPEALVGAFNQAKTPGLQAYEQYCLLYIQQLQERCWNAEHPSFSGSAAEKTEAISDFQAFQSNVKKLLGVEFARNLNGELTLFDKPVAEAGLSDGQKVILQLCVALHAQRSELDKTVFLLDEPENHLHPSAVIDLVKSLYEATTNAQIWIATHSVPLLAYIASEEPMSLWYVENGEVQNAGRRPQLVLKGLLGDDERIGQLNAFSGLPAQLASINYAVESLFFPQVIADGSSDDQVVQIRKMLPAADGLTKAPPTVLDYGAGKGRLLDGLAACVGGEGGRLSGLLDYVAYDAYDADREACQRVIATHFPSAEHAYFNRPEEFFGKRNRESVDAVVMCNVLHEISPNDWLDLFSSLSLVVKSLKDSGYLMLVEDQRIPVGEKAHKYGFLVLDTCHLKTLFAVTAADGKELFDFTDARGDGRLKAHFIAKSLLTRISAESITAAIEELRATAKNEITKIRALTPNYANGQLNGFWTQQFANASLFLAEKGK